MQQRQKTLKINQSQWFPCANHVEILETDQTTKNIQTEQIDKLRRSLAILTNLSIRSPLGIKEGLDNQSMGE